MTGRASPAATTARFATGLLPDLSARAAQLWLTYLGYAPGPVDGIMGRKTRAALEAFAEAEELPSGDGLDQALLDRLQRRAQG